jgi:hypothetical protein
MLLYKNFGLLFYRPGLEGTLESTDLSAESHVEEDHHLFNAEIQRRAASCLCSRITHVAHIAGQAFFYASFRIKIIPDPFKTLVRLLNRHPLWPENNTLSAPKRKVLLYNPAIPFKFGIEL